MTAEPQPVRESPLDEEAEGAAEPSQRRYFLFDEPLADPAPAQMSKQDFLAELRSAVTQAAEEALAATDRTTDDCPYLHFWFGYYSRQSSRHIERALHRYAPEAARAVQASDYIAIVTERVRGAVARWARTGEITGVPKDIHAWRRAGRSSPRQPSAIRSRRAFGPVLFKAREGGAHRTADPEVILATLGDGRPLDSGVRARMEPALGRGLGPVRLHTDAVAQRLASDLNARAFTVGRHVAFGMGQYQPGTVQGDALIAHEMAHVLQQKASQGIVAPVTPGHGSHDPLEADADAVAVGAMATLWGGAGRVVGAVARTAGPGLRSGLRLQRCGTFSERSSERYQGFDAAARPNGLVVPVGGKRTVAVRNKDELTLVSNDSDIAEVDATTPADGMTVTGVSHGRTSIEARKGEDVAERLDVSAKRRKSLIVDYHFMSDTAGHRTARSRGDEVSLTRTLNQVWERQANVRFQVGTVDAPQVQADLGPIVTGETNQDPEWQAVAAFATGGDYNVFLVWEFELRGSRRDATADSGTAGMGGETLLEDDTCDEYTLAHEAGHHLGLYNGDSHPSSGVMAGCGASDHLRVTKSEADIVNP